MSTTTYPFGADHDDRDSARVRADLSFRSESTTRSPRFGFVRRHLHLNLRLAGAG